MGIREWILGDYVKKIDKIEALEGEVKALKDKTQEMEGKLSKVGDLDNKVKVIETRLKILDFLGDNVKESRLWIKELLKDIEDIKLEIEAIKLKSEADSSIKGEVDDLELEARVYELIKKGQTSPTKIARMLAISKDKLYRILKRLQEARLITTKGKGRKKKYVLVLGAEGE